MRQSLRIIQQAADQMPPGRYITDDYRYAIPRKEDTLKDIESLIHHFINVSRGPTLPRGEAYAATEHPRGEQGFYVVSDGGTMAYRMRIRSPGFANVQALPLMTVGHLVSDLVAIIGSIDYVMPDIDRERTEIYVPRFERIFLAGMEARPIKPKEGGAAVPGRYRSNGPISMSSGA